MAEFYMRLKEALGKSGMTQSELCEKTGIPKSALSQYLSGAFRPKQDRTYILAKALNVSAAWLMGYDLEEPGRTVPAGFVPLPNKEVKLTKDSNKTVVFDTDMQELEAFHEYLYSMGFEARLDISRLNSYFNKKDGDTKLVKSDMKIWIVADHRSKAKYLISVNDMNLLKNNINGYALFQVSKMLEEAERL